MKSNQVLSTLNSGIFPSPILFTCGFTFDELITVLSKQKCTERIEAMQTQKKFVQSSTFCAGIVEMYNTKKKKSIYYPYLYIRDVFDFTDEGYCCLAHEIVHLCQFLLPDWLDRNKEHEAEAYFHTHIMSQCLKTLRPKKKSKK